ncbi:hypothetical protein ENBRE01_1474 [Enteropsectra breve]|nr:hypothetical protein ENBRE01_1474 [Enteropsectra breve]
MTGKKFTPDEIKRLVETRNQHEFIKKFNDNKSRAHIIKELWNDVSEVAALQYSGRECKEKYNLLLKEYRKNIVISNKIGEGRITWKHWNLMKENCHSGHEILPPDADESNIIAEQGDQENSTEAAPIITSTTSKLVKKVTCLKN